MVARTVCCFAVCLFACWLSPATSFSLSGLPAVGVLSQSRLTCPSLTSRRASLSLRCATATFKSKGAEPEGGWAPPPWKRKITNPMESLKPGQQHFGTVRNMESFGAYVDIGAERDGFVHISDISTEFVHSPRDLLQPGKQVKVWVSHVDEEAMKLQLTMISHKVDTELIRKLPIDKFAEIEGEEVDSKITRITNYGAYVDIGCQVDAWLHATELPKPRGAPRRMILDDLIVGRGMKVRIISVDLVQNRIKVTGRAKDDVEKERVFGTPPEDIRQVFQRGPRPPE